MLSPSRPVSLPDDCAAQLRRAILRGELPVGSRLPPERRLAEQLGVNRVTVRTALQRLASAGLVSVRQGQGYTVRDYRRSGGPELLGVLAELAGEGPALARVVADLLLVRRQLAAAVLGRLAASRPDPAPLGPAVAAFAAAVDGGESPAALAACEAEILAVLLSLTDSPVLGVCLNPIRLVLAELPVLVEAMFREPAHNAAGWQAVLAWLADPDPTGVGLLLDLLEARDSETVRLVGGP